MDDGSRGADILRREEEEVGGSPDSEGLFAGWGEREHRCGSFYVAGKVVNV